MSNPVEKYGLDQKMYENVLLVTKRQGLTEKEKYEHFPQTIFSRIFSSYDIEITKEMASKVKSFFGETSSSQQKLFRIYKGGNKNNEIKRIEREEKEIDD